MVVFIRHDGQIELITKTFDGGRAESHLSLSAPCGQRDGSGNTGPLSAFLQGGEVTVLMLHTSRPKPPWTGTTVKILDYTVRCIAALLTFEIQETYKNQCFYMKN